MDVKSKNYVFKMSIFKKLSIVVYSVHCVMRVCAGQLIKQIMI